MKKIVAAICGFLPLLLSAEEFAKGVVFEDLNGNEVRDSGEKGIPGIGVSDGSNIVETDAKGHWRLPVAEDVIYFVLKPSGGMVPLKEVGRRNTHQSQRVFMVQALSLSAMCHNLVQRLFRIFRYSLNQFPHAA